MALDRMDVEIYTPGVLDFLKRLTLHEKKFCNNLSGSVYKFMDTFTEQLEKSGQSKFGYFKNKDINDLKNSVVVVKNTIRVEDPMTDYLNVYMLKAMVAPVYKKTFSTNGFGTQYIEVRTRNHFGLSGGLLDDDILLFNTIENGGTVQVYVSQKKPQGKIPVRFGPAATGYEDGKNYSKSIEVDNKKMTVGKLKNITYKSLKKEDPVFCDRHKFEEFSDAWVCFLSNNNFVTPMFSPSEVGKNVNKRYIPNFFGDGDSLLITDKILNPGQFEDADKLDGADKRSKSGFIVV